MAAVYDFFMTIGQLVKYIKASRGEDSDFVAKSKGWRNLWFNFSQDFIDLRDALAHNSYKSRLLETEKTKIQDKAKVIPLRRNAVEKTVSEVVLVCFELLDDLEKALEFVKS